MKFFALLVRIGIGAAAVVAVAVTFMISGDVTVRMTVCMGAAAGLIIWGIAEAILRTPTKKRAAR